MYLWIFQNSNHLIKNLILIQMNKGILILWCFIYSDNGHKLETQIKKVKYNLTDCDMRDHVKPISDTTCSFVQEIQNNYLKLKIVIPCLMSHHKYWTESQKMASNPYCSKLKIARWTKLKITAFLREGTTMSTELRSTEKAIRLINIWTKWLMTTLPIYSKFIFPLSLSWTFIQHILKAIQSYH